MSLLRNQAVGFGQGIGHHRGKQNASSPITSPVTRINWFWSAWET